MTTGLNHKAIRTYRRALEERWQAQQARQEQRRQEALAAVRRAVQEVIPAYPAVRRVYLHGSVTRPGAFRPDSDIDLAVDGLDLGQCLDLWGALESAAPGWTLDVRPLKTDDYFSARVRQRGIKIYG